MKRSVIFISLVLLFAACNTPTQLAKYKTATFKKINWLLGRWEIRTTNYILSENWQKENDTSFIGKSIMLVSRDTVLYDIMNIKSSKQYIYLSSKSKISTDGPLNIFKLVKITKDRIIFENPSNIDENKITYLLKTPVTLSILIEGKEKSVESYNLRKVIK